MLFVKRRFREFALYQVIGLSKRNLVHIVMVEQIAIYFCNVYYWYSNRLI